MRKPLAAAVIAAVALAGCATTSTPEAQQPTSSTLPAASTSAVGISINTDLPAIVADLDGQPGDEAIIVLRCATEGASPFTPFAVKLDATGKVVGYLGFVLHEPGKELPPVDETKPVSVAERVVLAAMFDGTVRGYSYKDGKFVQVNGPTA